MGLRFNFNLRSASYRTKLTYLFVGAIIGLSSVLFSMYIIRQLTEKEINEVKLWSHAMTMASNNKNSLYGATIDTEFNKLLIEIVNNNTIPSIITDEDLRVIQSTNVSKATINNKRRLTEKLEELAKENDPIEVRVFGSGLYYIFYGKSTLLALLKIYPFLQIGIIVGFILIVFISFNTSKQDEQKRVWIGMAKETAHQLGTPTSSLLGWMEYLKGQEIEQFVVEEMGKDISRLLKVVDRFSKIGSQTNLEPKNINTIVTAVVTYFSTRIPKQVQLRFNFTEGQPVQAMVNEALFEWVIENLLKNALDALAGKGSIDVSLHQDNKWIYIDVQDTGKGMPKSSFGRVFSPGYTTKTRGWGLGLSLSKRIIAESHKGRIFVADSEIDKGTTMRVMLHRL